MPLQFRNVDAAPDDPVQLRPPIRDVQRARVGGGIYEATRPQFVIDTLRIERAATTRDQVMRTEFCALAL